ncbi:hypothetical protein OE810_11315 [Rhodobacteraceae bacterium XHP0102]|nr:hypothetical protein [Rhodobacteraceae bacterium XHP0102]
MLSDVKSVVLRSKTTLLADFCGALSLVVLAMGLFHLPHLF